MMRADVKRLNEAEAINLDRCAAASDRQIKANRRQQALLAAAGEDGVIRHWAIVKVAHRRENDVDKSMASALIEHWLPLRKEEKPSGGRRRGAEGDGVWTLAWPGYLFVRIPDTAEAWAGIASIRHVVSVLGVDGFPFFIADKIMLKIKAELATLKEVPSNAGTVFTKGGRVRVVDGPFASFPGVVDEMGEGSHAGRATVEVMIFGRVVPVELDLAQLAKRE
jgi:transcriptional antiterminator NusG